MDYYLDLVKFSTLPKDEVQKLLESFLQKTNPDKLSFNPQIINYSDTYISFGMQKHYGRMSLSVNYLLRNLNSSLNPLGEEIVDNTFGRDFYQLQVGNIEYLDTDIIKVAHYGIVIRIDSISRLISGGVKQFIKNKHVYGVTNGRLITMMEMRDHPLYIDQLYTDFLEPNGFKIRNDFVCGYCGKYERKDFWKPLDWCLVPWLESVITPFGNFVKFKS